MDDGQMLVLHQRFERIERVLRGLTHPNVAGTRVLITGGTGTLGTALTAALLAQGYNVEVTSRDPHRQSTFRARFPDVGCSLLDIGHFDGMLSAIEGKDIVIHAAALKRVDTGEYAVAEFGRVNIYGTDVVADACERAGVQRAVFISSDKACVERDTPIRLKSGKTMFIHEIVDQQLDVEVETMGEHGIEYRRVIGWYKNRRDGRRLFRIAYQYGPQNGNKHPNGGCVILTEDHPVLTADGWKQANEIRDGELLPTRELCPNEKQMAFIIGCVLGDSHITQGYRAGIKFYHCDKQLEWLSIKNDVLSAFDKSEIAKQNKTIGCNSYVSNGFELRRSAWAKELREVFYPEGKKIIPKQLVSDYFCPELLAAWYLDDGCFANRQDARLATHSFKHEDVEWLVQFLRDRGMECYIQNCKYKDKIYPELRFTVQGSKMLFSLIAPFVPPTMRYKISDESEAYDQQRWMLGAPETYFGKAIVSELIDTFVPLDEPITLPPQNRDIQTCKRGHALTSDNVSIIPQTGSRQCLACQRMVNGRKVGTNHLYFVRDVYCINVEETHNFISHGIVLHNCEPINFYGMTKAVGERIWLARNKTSGVLRTRFSAVRYGNVMGSNGSVLQLWRQQVAQGNQITVREPETTRFFMLLDSAVQLVLDSLTLMEGGEIFVPSDMPAFALYDLAREVAPESAWLRSPLGPREKIHERLIARGEYCEHLCNGIYRVFPTRAGDFETPSWSCSETAQRLTGAEAVALLEK